jgi:hypothetical protein
MKMFLNRFIWFYILWIALVTFSVNSKVFADFMVDQRNPATSTDDFFPPERHTHVSIKGNQFYINGDLTYKRRYWKGNKIEGLLLNSRMVQGIFDDLNPETRHLWAYPDTKVWDPDRNTREFIQAMPHWRAHGLLAFTLNLQGGSPEGYSKSQPWHNSAIAKDGSLRADYMSRLEKILDKADELGMVVVLGIFYFGQDERIADEKAIIKAVDNTIDWLGEKNYRHILIEICNETGNTKYDHNILKPNRVHELIQRVKAKKINNYSYPAGTSYGGGKIPDSNVVKVSDFILIHGNNVNDPAEIIEMTKAVKNVNGYRNQPIINNEDDHYDFEKPVNNFVNSIKAYTSWGYFDFRRHNEGFEEGFQSMPIDWSINSERKKAFFSLLKEITGDFNGYSSKIGVFRPSTGQWYIDLDGNKNWSGCGPDACWGIFGSPGDLPVSGDWNGDGITNIGVFRNGAWYLDANGSGAWDAGDIAISAGKFGSPNDIPITGDWNNTGTTKIGVYRPSTRMWYLDNGGGVWSGCGIDICSEIFGAPGDLPVGGVW